MSTNEPLSDEAYDLLQEKKFQIVGSLLCLFLLLALTSCDKEDAIQNLTIEYVDRKGVPTEINGGCDSSKTPVYLGKEGLISIEMESAVSASPSWSLENEVAGATGNGYLVWRGSNNFSSPGSGILRFKIRVDHPGTYRFIWRSRILHGDSNTEANDTWLRLPDADHFYARKSDGHIVYPKGAQQPPIAASQGQSNTVPQGAGKNGWFKVYMNTIDRWHWRSTTSDHDPHHIYAVFNESKDYTVELSGRSNGHGIDRFVLFHSDITEAVATELTQLSGVLCED